MCCNNIVFFIASEINFLHQQARRFDIKKEAICPIKGLLQLTINKKVIFLINIY